MMEKGLMSSLLNDPRAWGRISPYLDQALDLEPDERAPWLNELETSQPEIAGILRALFSQPEALNARGLDGSPLPLTSLDMLMPLLEQMVRDRAGANSGEVLQNVPSFAQSVASEHRVAGVSEGTVLGSYRLLREIGHGGMSAVWLAERCDGQLKRQVALKLPFEGSRHAQMAERFKRERDILATLTHPNIARLYDAGVSAAGQSYLAMEYVHGTALTRYCDDARLSIRERLRIFLQVLAAVGFAHAQLVLHRDLKPSNILVTEHGRVALLDFGIAQLLSQEATAESALTEIAGRVLTPDYASPEQIAGHLLSTTSDVYSLGVLLYELLAGGRPFGSQHTPRRALEEAILTQDPPRPSQFALTEEAAAARHTTPRKLAQTLKGDLDTIVLKALKKVPGERYRSTDVFAHDIANYLGNLPVSARPDSTWYRFRRFVSRYKLQVSTATVALLAIIVGGATSVWQARAAAQERDRAFALASRNTAVTEFMGMLISEAAESDKPVTVSEMIARSEELALADAGGNAENRAAVLEMIAGQYLSLGDVGKAAQLEERALALLGNSHDRGLRSLLVCDHALAISSMGQADTALRTITRELDTLQSDPKTASTCLYYRSSIAAKTGDAEGALRYARLALDRLYEAPHSTVDEGALLSAVALAYHSNGHSGQANDYFELALQKYIEAGRDQGPQAIVVRNNWAVVSAAAGVPKRALELYDRTLSIMAERHPSSQTPAYLICNRAQALELIGRYEAARDAYTSGLQLAKQQQRQSTQAACLLGLASVAQESGLALIAARHLEQRLELLGSSLPADNVSFLAGAVIQGKLDLAAGRLDDARAEFDRALRSKRTNATVIAAALGKAEAELLAGATAMAAKDAQAALDVALALQGGVQYSNYTGLSWLMLGRALKARGEIEQARKALEAAVAQLSNTVDPDHPKLVRARELLAAASG
jgi:serine/threonine-protein kinase